MGYASYDTPLGPAGYAVEDICNEEGCDAEIDRGLSFLCGTQPGRPDEHGCGLWFCDKHLYVAPRGVNGFLCNECILKYDGVDNEDAEEVGKVRRLIGPLTHDNTKEYLHLIEENEKLHMPKRPKMAKTPHEVTAETAREVAKVTQLVYDVGDMLDHLPEPELITAALLELQAAVEDVVRGQVTK